MPTTDRLNTALSDRYHIERELGAGGMATVYLARDLKHDREVALKVLRADLSAVIGTDRFLSEVKIAAKLDHPHILTLIDSGEADGLLYYVLPYVRGESLRAKLNRERQLGLEEAVLITTQVASALDYAHEQGVVHRDIKPENILLHHGEAVLADFGIALAVKEAGGNRLTETGLSLGTPQYMSPEQATGDRLLDKRSDIYSLGAVFYELIAGEPPVTGATAQAMIAKLLTERPVRLRVVRNTISESMERATEKALAKVPADRFSTAGDFARALAVAAPRESNDRFPVSKRQALIGGIALAAVATAIWFVARGKGDDGPVAVLRERTQITNSGRVSIPAISPDGKSIAYVVTNCNAKGCRYGIEMQDAGSSSSRRLVDGVSAVYGIRISPDRRNILFLGTKANGIYGTYILSTLGGETRYISPGNANFFAGGDSLFFHRGGTPTDHAWIIVAGIDGIPRDSIEVTGTQLRLGAILPVKGSSWLIAEVNNPDAVEARAIQRNGKTGGILKRPVRRGNFITASSDALWITTSSPSSPLLNIVRVGFNPSTGKLASHGDTLQSGTFTTFDVTDDGRTLLFDEGSIEVAAWAMTPDQAIKGAFTEERLISRSTSDRSVGPSRDGSFLVMSQPGTADSTGNLWTLRPTAGGPEIQIPGRHLAVTSVDSTRIILTDNTPAGTKMSWVELRTGRVLNSYVIPDQNELTSTTLGDNGWLWVTNDGRTFRIKQGAASPRSLTIPEWYKTATGLTSSADGKYAAFTGWRAPAEDSIGVAMISVADGKITHLWATIGESSQITWLNDGTLLVQIFETPESLTFYRLTTAGVATRLGSVPRPVRGASVSRDMHLAAIVTRDRKGDAWMSRVVLVGSK